MRQRFGAEVLAVLVFLVGGAGCFGMCSGGGGPPGGKISPESQTPACRDEIAGILGAFATQLGLPIAAEPADADALFSTGTLARRYARDGARFEMRFGVDKREDGCFLMLYERVEARPGQTVTNGGDFGSVPMSVCRCAP